jgi:phospholipid N-methyltransferase
MKKRLFLKQFFKQKKMVGAVAPSSRFLAHKMLNHLPLSTAKVIVELGPGNGVFTKRIIKEMGENTQLIVIELNDLFYEELSSTIQDPRVHIFHDSANKIGDFIKQIGQDKADIIISSLPLANFPEDIKTDLLDSIHNSLDEKGTFVQFQYSLQSKKAIKKRFVKTKITYTPFNIPPAFVYSCMKTALS